MVPNKWITKLYHAFETVENVIANLLGDPNWSDSVEEGEGRITQDYMSTARVSDVSDRQEV